MLSGQRLLPLAIRAVGARVKTDQQPFYAPGFSFRAITDKYPDLAGDITDCLSGDVNKDFTRLFSAIEEFAPLPEALPVGKPLMSLETQAA